MKKYKVALMSGTFTAALFALCTFSACSKNDDCFSEIVKAKHENDICPTDCPGVIGCNGKNYCNMCEANKEGIYIIL